MRTCGTGYPSFASIFLFAAIATAFGPAPTTSSVGVFPVACSGEVLPGVVCILFASWVTKPSLSISVLSWFAFFLFQLIGIGTLLQFKFDRIERLLETDDNSGCLNWIDDTLLLLFLEVFFQYPQLLNKTAA